MVILGGGQAGYQTAVTARERGYPGPIAIVAAEAWLPYQRPPLSKGFLLGKLPQDELMFRPAEYFRTRNIDLHLGTPAKAIDRAAQRVLLPDGRALGYQSLVLATGARARALTVPGSELPGVHTLRSLDDSLALQARLLAGAKVVVVGGGFVGLEVAAAARLRGARVTLIETLPLLMARAVTTETAAFYADQHRSWDTDLFLGEQVRAIEAGADGGVGAVVTASGRRIAAEVVVVGIGAVPNIELATAAGLTTEDGVIVDEQLQTSDRAIFAIGDCARFPVAGLSSSDAPATVRLESVQNATDQAKHVARSIAGETLDPYAALPWFWSDQNEVRLQIAGLTTGHDEVVVYGDPVSGSFSVLCFRQGRLLGADSINAPRDHIAVRRILSRHWDPNVGPTSAHAASPDFNLHAYATSR